MCVVQTFHTRTVFFEQLIAVAFLCNRTRDNQRCTCIVNQHRIDFIDDCVVVFALYQLVRTDCHIVAQVVETKLVVGSVGDIGLICTTTGFGVWLVFVDAVNFQAVELVNWTHPFRVTFCQIIVDGNHVYATASKRVEEHWQSSHKRFTFTSCHFRNFSLMQNRTSNKLHIVVNHIPRNRVSASNPRVAPNRLVAFDCDVRANRSQITVVVGGSCFHRFVCRKAAGCVFHNGECVRKNFIECFCNNLVSLFF